MVSRFFRNSIFICSFAVTFGCHSDHENNLCPSTDNQRTVLIYVSAQNSLGYKKFHEKDSIEISNGTKYLKEANCLLVYVDDAATPRIYRYIKNNEHPVIVRQWEHDVNSSAPKTLEEVLAWTKQHYTAKEYGLVMWSHSDGWLPSTNKDYQSESTTCRPYSFGIDVGSDGNMKHDTDRNNKTGTQMDIADMASAIQKSGVHLEYIFFDSCLMQGLETAYDLRHVANYIIAGPMQIPGCGANYTHMIKKGLFSNAAYDIVSTYYNDALNGFEDPNDEYYDYGVVISSIRTDKLEKLAVTTAKLLAQSHTKNKESVNLEGILNYQSYCHTYMYRPHNYDAQEAMKRVLNEEDYPSYLEVLNEVIVSKSATPSFWIGPGNYTMQNVDPEHFCGVSTFIPQDIYTSKAKVCPFGDLNNAFQKTEWYTDAGWKVTGW